jgi:plastocyanin
MKKLTLIMTAFMLAGALVFAACGKTPGGANSSAPSGPVTSIGMDTSNFTVHSAQVKANTPITFDDTVGGGGTHILCIGTGTGGSNTCAPKTGAPTQLNTASGLMVQAGSKTQITFPSTGTFRVICTIHTGMYVDVTVSS